MRANSSGCRFDLIILGIGLLTNLVENCDANRQRLIQVKSKPPYDCHYSLTDTDDVIDCLEALGMLFSVRYEAAKLIEEEQEAEIEEAERRKALPDVTHDQPQTGSSLRAGQTHGSGGGGWQESDSGIFWEPCDTSMLDSSSDGLAAMHAARQQAAALAGSGMTASQDEDENYTKVLHTAGRHMEDSIMAAYIALLIGTLIQHKQDLAEHVRETLPSFSFSPMVQMLSKFLGFMNLTNASGMNASKSIQHIIEILEAC